jgi:protein phosphatase
MLVCPHCQFENPTANNFCQKCGTSLTQNTCPACSSLVPFEQIHCQTCGAIAGVLWQAIISGTEGVEASNPETPLMTGCNGYLDIQQRYQLIEPLSEVDEWGTQETVVLDCQPFQLSLLETLVLPQSADSAELAEAQEAAGSESWVDAMEALRLPAIAQIYITLRSEFGEVVPAIHNAWHWDGKSVVLLENYSTYAPLLDVWRDQQSAVPLIQILQWLYEMVELWEGLSVWGVQQSVLILANLHVEPEEQVLLLGRLYANPADLDPTLQDLGRIWQKLFAESETTYIEAIAQLIADLDAGEIGDTTLLKARIEAIAHALESDRPLPNELQLDQRPLTSDDSDSTNRAAALGIQETPTRIELPREVLDEVEEGNFYDGDEMPTIVLPMQLFNLEEVGRTDVGKQRDHNEDYYGIETQILKLESPSNKVLHARNLYILCDGMGGHASGEVASALAVDTIRTFFQEEWNNAPFPPSSDRLPDVATMTKAVLLANQAIYDVNQQNARSGSGRMGTTLVMMAIHDAEVSVAHVGDSRLYRYTRKRGLEQVTIDHEVGQREIQRGVDPEVAYSRPDAYQLTQALGPRDEHFVKPDVQFFELNEDMLLILCSDGLSDNDFLEKHVESNVMPLLSSQTNLDRGVAELIEMANQYNGHDNITAVVVRAKVRPSMEQMR